MNSLKILIASLGALSVILVGGCEVKQNSPDRASNGKKEAVGEVNVYSGRHYDSDLALFEAFTEKTGIRVNLIEAGGDALIERIAQERDNSPADLFITADAGILWRAAERGIFRDLNNKTIEERVPAQFRHPSGQWFALSKRARIIIYNKEMGLPNGLSTYAGLADPALDHTICVRSSSNVYNQSLLASRIAHDGKEAAEEWARGVVHNFARRPQGNDTTQIEAVAAGLCRLGIVNSYYVARYIGSADPETAAISEKVSVLFPDQNGRGAHINISGAGVTKYAPNARNAEALLEFLLTEEAQKAFAFGNNEYPVVRGIEVSGPISTLGEFKEDTLAVTALGENQRLAVQIFDRVGWP